MRILILIIPLLITACASKPQIHHNKTNHSAHAISHAGFYDFLLDAAAGEITTWQNKALFKNIHLSGFSATIKFYDFFPHDKWLSGLRLTLVKEDNTQSENTVIDLWMKRENNRVAVTLKPSAKSESSSQEYIFRLDQYIHLQASIDEKNFMQASINGVSETLQLDYKPTSLRIDAIGSDAHIILNVYEKK